MPIGITGPTITVGVLAGDTRAIEFAVTTLFRAATARHHVRSLDTPVRDGCMMKISAGKNRNSQERFMQLVITSDVATFHACTYKVLGCSKRHGNLRLKGHSNGRRLLRAEGMAVMPTDKQISSRTYFVLFDGSTETFGHAAADIVDFAMQGARKAPPLRREVREPALLTVGGYQLIDLKRAAPHALAFEDVRLAVAAA